MIWQLVLRFIRHWVGSLKRRRFSNYKGMRRSHGLLSRQNEGAQTKSNVSPHTVSLPLIFPSTSIFSSPRRDTLCQRFIYLRWIVVNQKYGDCSQKSRQSSEMMSVGHCNSTNISLIWWRICKLMKWGELRVNGKKKKKFLCSNPARSHWV